MKAIEKLKELNACGEAIEWCKDNNIKTLQEAWEKCERGDWMLWLYARLYPDNKREITLAKGHCANTVRSLMKDKRSIAAVDTAIRYGENNATDDELKDAATAAYAAYAAYTAYADDAAYAAAADAATDAAAASYVAYAAAYTAYDAAYAAAADADAACAAYAAAAYDAAYTADADAAKKENQKLTSDICRKYLSIKESEL